MSHSEQADANAVNVISKMFESVENGDMDSFKSCFSDRATIWLNVSRVDNNVQDTSAHLAEMLKKFKSFRYIDREFFQSGRRVFAKYTVSLSPIEGDEFAVPAIAHIQISDDGKISRLEEYFDSGAFRQSGG